MAGCIDHLYTCQPNCYNKTLDIYRGGGIMKEKAWYNNDIVTGLIAGLALALLLALPIVL